MNNRLYPERDDAETGGIPVSDPGAAGPSVVPVEVAIVYGDLDAGQRALRLVADLSVSLADEVEFHPKLWRLSLLESPEIRASLVEDFAGANIIILAPGEATVSADVQRWLAGCVERAEGEPAAIIVMVTEDGADRPETAGQRWGALKRSSGCELFATRANRLSGYLPE